jgi:acetyl esterase/lipase
MKCLILLFMGLLSSSFASDFLLWETGEMPGIATVKPETTLPNKGNRVTRLTNVSNPSLAFCPARKGGQPAPVVIVCPGGGYQVLAYNLEGTEVVEWLNSIGVSAVLLKYRVPNNRAGALEDARRAVRLVREHSKDWNIDPARVGMLGFSAGGHLAAACSNSSDRPDFTILVYPAYLFKKGSIELVNEIKVDPQTPPAFIVQAWDDKSYYRSSLAYATALDARGISVELHLFAKGGHGFGLRSKFPAGQWPMLCEAWMKESGFLR